MEKPKCAEIFWQMQKQFRLTTMVCIHSEISGSYPEFIHVLGIHGIHDIHRYRGYREYRKSLPKKERTSYYININNNNFFLRFLYVQIHIS